MLQWFLIIIILTYTIMEILHKLIGRKFPTLIFSQEGVLAKTFQSLAKEGDLPVQSHLSLGSSYEDYEVKDLDILSGKMLKECCLQEADGTLPTSFVLFPKVAIISGGKFSMPKTSVSLKTESVSLSSVLEKKVPKKYFLSDKVMKSIMGKVGTSYESKLLTLSGQIIPMGSQTKLI